MKFIKTELEGLTIIEPKVFGDDRGYFFESYKKENFDDQLSKINFIQDNEALSSKNIFRGFHYQLPPFAQSKLVRVIQGSVLDIVIDIRPSSKTYGKVFQIELSAANKKQLFVPQGFAHGYISLEDNTIFSYKVDQYYNKENERGISFLDPGLDIDWPVDPQSLIISEKDGHNPNFGKHSTYE